MYKTRASLILASASPRRQELLSRLGLSFRIVPSGLDEDGAEDGPPETLAGDWARKKAETVARKMGPAQDCWYLGVDTVVVIEGEILGKPESPAQAREFLGRLSGQWHQVVSGYCLWHPDRGAVVENAVGSRVKIKRLEPAEIAAYVGTGEPLDKAGAYAVQGIGAFMVERIEGSYTNVVGLPLTEVVDDLKRLGIIELGD